MNEYVNQILSALNIKDANNGIMIVNSEGVVEAFNYAIYPNAMRDANFAEKVVGRYILDVYPELTESTSTVMQVLKTGKTICGNVQKLSWEKMEIKLTTITYPIMDGERIAGAVDVAELLETAGVEYNAKKKQSLYTLDDIITQNKDMIALKKTVQSVASNNSSVLIYGETGTGKELFAEALHTSSIRCDKPFISQNCAAIPENLLESIFFGTERGSFTGAESKPGIFEMANNGTLFLDEINSLNFSMQAKLLKTIEEQKVRRIGGTKDVPLNVRIVCASNEPPEQLIISRRMRMDLYYRIGVVRINIPPLRSRVDDINILINHFIDVYNKKTGRKILGISNMASDILNKWEWYGNVRELRNVIESAFNLEKTQWISLDSIHGLTSRFAENIQHDDVQVACLSRKDYGSGDSSALEELLSAGIPLEIVYSDKLTDLLDGNGINLDNVLNECEKYLIVEAIKREKNISRVAKKLGLSPQKPRYRMRKLQIETYINAVHG